MTGAGQERVNEPRRTRRWPIGRSARPLLAWVVVLLAPQVAPAQPQVRVRVWAAYPSSHVDVVPSPEVKIRTCATCAPAAHREIVPLDAEGERVRVAGQAVAGLWITGRYHLTSEAAGATLGHSVPLEVRAARGTLVVVMTIGLEDYVANVLAGEASVFRSDEALMAMAVAARTFATRLRDRHPGEGYHLCDSTHCQATRWSVPSDAVRAAVAATESELVWFGAAPAATFYHRACGGMTEDGSHLDRAIIAPYLRRQPDPACSVSRSEWRSELRKDEVRQALLAAGIPAPAALGRFAVVRRTESGRAESIAVAPGLTLTAEQLRRAVGRSLGWDRIRSDLYEIADSGDVAVFQGRGQGHGVGLCQSGADRMGQEGRNYAEILAFYYPGTTVGVTPGALGWQRRASERIDLYSTEVMRDSRLLALAERAMRFAQQETGLAYEQRVQVKIYPSVEAFRNATGEPGWVAGVTRASNIRLQPLAAFERHPGLEPVLRHEMLHVLFETHARAQLPVWFREGLVLALLDPLPPKRPGTLPPAGELDALLARAASREQANRAAEEARQHVLLLLQRYGRQAVIGWLNSGMPSELVEIGAGPSAPVRR